MACTSAPQFQELLVELRLAREKSAGATRAPHVRHIDLPDAVKLPDVKDYCPPGASIWTNNISGG
eukprot:5381246-Heterocapsa_arctica.AAC.1